MITESKDVPRQGRKISLDLTRGEKVMNVSARWALGGEENLLRRLEGEWGLGSDSLSTSSSSSTAVFDSKGRRAGIGRRGLAGSSPRASDKNLYTIQGEGLKGGHYLDEGRPYCFQGALQ